MFFANLVLAASTLSAVFAAPLLPRDDASSSSLAYFTTLAAHSSSPIHNRTVNANGYGFWIGKETKSSCPVQNITDCPVGNVTVMAVNGTRGTCILVRSWAPLSGRADSLTGSIGCRSTWWSSGLCRQEWITSIYCTSYRQQHTSRW